MTVPSNLPKHAAQVPTTVLADLLGDRDLDAQVCTPRIQTIYADPARIAGWAFTVAGGPVTAADSGPDTQKVAAIDAVQPGQVAVWAGSCIEDVCLFGDLLAAGMAARGVVGAVVDGGVRDVGDIQETGFGVWARYRTPKASSGVWRVRSWQRGVEVTGTAGGEVHIEPGDLVVADLDGAVAIPRPVAAEVVEAAQAHTARETVIRGRIEAGESMQALTREFGRL